MSGADPSEAESLRQWVVRDLERLFRGQEPHCKGPSWKRTRLKKLREAVRRGVDRETVIHFATEYMFLTDGTTPRDMARNLWEPRDGFRANLELSLQDSWRARDSVYRRQCQPDRVVVPVWCSRVSTLRLLFQNSLVVLWIVQ